jgi:hypothetical protein
MFYDAYCTHFIHIKYYNNYYKYLDINFDYDPNLI